MQKQKNKETGITLISLVVTIIDLIILAGVSIAMLVGENGIITQAQRADELTTQAQQKEVIELAVASVQAQGTLELDKTSIEEALCLQLGDSIGWSVTNNDDSNFINIIIGDNEFIVYKNGEVFVKDKIMTAEDIAMNATKYYGLTVSNYETNIKELQDATDWKIFYSDGVNIFLISSDYIEYKYLPKSLDGTSLDVDDTNYRVYMESIVQNYKESNNVTDSRVNELNKKFYETNFSITSSMKALSYMLNPNLWTDFCNENYAGYVIGGPTIELLLKSYNQKYDTHYETLSTNTGYQISLDGGNSFLDYCIDREVININDSLYNVKREENIGMWLASPSNRGNSFIMCLQTGSGTITGAQYSDVKFGIRPIVCLKQNAKIISTDTDKVLVEM